MWHVSSRSGVATLRTAIHLLVTYLLTYLQIPTGLLQNGLPDSAEANLQRSPVDVVAQFSRFRPSARRRPPAVNFLTISRSLCTTTPT